MLLEFPADDGCVRIFDTDAPVLGVDFDGTVTKFSNGRFTLSDPVQDDCQQVLNRLHEARCTIIVWTCRGNDNLIEALQFLKMHRIPYDFINRDVPWISDYWVWAPKSAKIDCTYYIDDRNIGGFIGWKQVEQCVLQHPYFQKEKVV
jgi:hypothetical protein